MLCSIPGVLAIRDKLTLKSGRIIKGTPPLIPAAFPHKASLYFGVEFI